MSEQERAIIELIRIGVIELGQYGRFWRRKTFTRTGRVKHVFPSRLAETVRADGYVRVRATVDGREVSALGHRLVWILAHGPIPDSLEVNHRNGQRADNWLDNLELVTKSANLDHSYRELGRPRPTGERNPHCKLTADQVREIRARANEGTVALGREFGVTHQAVRRILLGLVWRDEFPEPTRELAHA